MKKLFCGILAVVLAGAVLVGCAQKERPQNDNLTFETISVTFSDGKTVSTDMDQETVRGNMEVDPYNTLEFENSTDDEWTLDYGLFTSYKEGNVTRIHVVEEGESFSTSLGVAQGESVASMKEKLGEAANVDTEEDYTYYQYCFNLVEGRYEMFQGSLDEFFTRIEEDSKPYCVTIGSKNDKVTSFSVYALY